MFWGDFSCIFVVVGVFCWFWSGLVLTAMLCIYPYWVAPVCFRPFLQFLKIIPLIAFSVITFFFYLINKQHLNFLPKFCFAWLFTWKNRSSLLKIYVHAFAHAVSFKILPCVWQYLVWMGMFRKICRSRWKTSLENSEGKREPVEALSLIISHRKQPEGSVEVAVKAKKFGELTQSSPAL